MCTLELGVTLYQNQDGVDWVIGYASRAHNKTKYKYLAYTLKWVITEQFHDYLCGSTFVVYTDNNPLTYVLTSVELDATGHHSVVSC